MQSDYAESCIVWIRQSVDELVKGIAARDVIVDARGADEFVVEGVGEERIWEVAEELFENAGDAVDVVKEILLFAEVDSGRIYSMPSKLLQTQSTSGTTGPYHCQISVLSFQHASCPPKAGISPQPQAHTNPQPEYTEEPILEPQTHHEPEVPPAIAQTRVAFGGSPCYYNSTQHIGFAPASAGLAAWES